MINDCDSRVIEGKGYYNKWGDFIEGIPDSEEEKQRAEYQRQKMLLKANIRDLFWRIWTENH